MGDNILYTREKSKKRVKGEKKSRLDVFCDEFASELDIFDSEIAFPDWVLTYRENVLRKITPEFRKICRYLRDLGLGFKIKWPVEIDGRWKYADILFPNHRTVLIVTNAKELGCRPHWMLSDRGEFFHRICRVLEVETLSELQRKVKIKSSQDNA